MAARLLEREGVIIELLEEREVVKHGCDVEQLGVEGDAPLQRIPRRPQVGPYRVVEERR